MKYLQLLLFSKKCLWLTKAGCHTRFRKRPEHGSRYLKNSSKVFDFNAWDNVEWDVDQEEQAKKKVEENSTVFATPSEQEKYEVDAVKYWNAFYDVHQNRFFKDRHWLFTEFPELAPHKHNSKMLVSVHCNSQPHEQEAKRTCENENNSESVGEEYQPSDSEERVSLIKVEPSRNLTILEIGCGVGNTVFPILQYNNDSNLFVYCCDLSPTAIQILKATPEYDPKRCHAFVYDIAADDEQLPPFLPESLDIAVLIFVLSAIHPEKMQQILNWIYRYVRPGGLVVFRDYGRFDMAQLRFKKGRCLSDNFYARGDGTRVYFFTQDEIKTLFESAGFIEEQNLIDRRLQVNRGKLLKMYRVWIQAKYRKPDVLPEHKS